MDSQETYQGQSLFTRDAQLGRRLRTGSFLLNALLSLIILFSLASASLAQSPLTDDAHVSLLQGNANHGADPNLNISPTENIYLMFKLSSTLPAATPGSEVGRATLKLYAGAVKAAGKLDVYAVLGAWDESAITSSNSPPLGSLVSTTAQIGTDQKGKFIVIDITTLVRQWLGDDGQGANGLPNHGLALLAHPVDATTPQVAEITFDSKENSQTSHEPQLNILLEGSAGGLQRVEHDPSLKGDGTSASPLGVASGGINTVHLANDAVTGEKIATNAVTTSELADGAVTSPKITVPLSLTSADPGFTLSIANTGAGAAITANGAINTTTQYNLGGSRVLSNGGVGNLFAGEGAGAVNTSFGSAFFGFNAGMNNTSARLNSFFGYRAGRDTTTGCCNSFFGNDAGIGNVSGRSNLFAGGSAGARNSSGSFNTLVGDVAGWDFINDVGNTTGILNTYLGYATGWRNTVGNNVTLIGAQTNVGASDLNFATAIGAGAVVNASNTVVLGRSADTVQVPGALNVAGTFGANILNATTQFNIGGDRVLTVSAPAPGSPKSNVFAGVGAGASNTVGSANSFFGFNAGAANNTGGQNSFYGYGAGAFNTVGRDNSFFGSNAGARNVSGIGNAFFGKFAGIGNTSGNLNAFFGDETGLANTDGILNSFFGAAAGGFNTTGSGNSFFGSRAGINNVTGNNLTVIGADANAVGNISYATAIGAGTFVTTSNTIVLGRPSETVQIPGALSVTGAFGANILDAATQFNIGGNRVLSISGGPGDPNSNIFAGVGAGVSNTTGVANSFFGIGAGSQNTDGFLNDFFGRSTGAANTIGNLNSFFGSYAGFQNTTGSENAFFGQGAGFGNTTGSQNSFFGRESGLSNKLGNRNSFFGYEAGRETGRETSGDDNSFFGYTAGFENRSGSSNSFFGRSAGRLTSTGNFNTFIGRDAGFNNTAGSNLTVVGASANVGADNLSNATALGYRAQVSQSNSLVLGGISGVNSGTDTNVGIGTTAPRTKLHLRSGKIYVEANGQGVILKSPGGACFELTVTDAGTLATTAVACP